MGYGVVDLPGALCGLLRRFPRLRRHGGHQRLHGPVLLCQPGFQGVSPLAPLLAPGTPPTLQAGNKSRFVFCILFPHCFDRFCLDFNSLAAWLSKSRLSPLFCTPETLLLRAMNSFCTVIPTQPFLPRFRGLIPCAEYDFTLYTHLEHRKRHVVFKGGEPGSIYKCKRSICQEGPQRTCCKFCSLDYLQ
jgi:hypothetical protein